MSGLLVVVEGSDGCGKTTLVTMIKNRLIFFGHDADIHRAPGGTVFGEKTRNAIFNSDREPDNLSVCFSMLASHNQFFKEIVETKVNAGKIVIADRFIESTIAYQGVDEKTNKIIRDSYDLILDKSNIKILRVFIKTDVKTCMERIKTRGVENFLDTKDFNFYNRVSKSYDSMINQYKVSGDPTMTIELDNNGTLEQTSKKIDIIVTQIIKHTTT